MARQALEGEALEERVTFRLLPTERQELEKDAGGPSKVSAYLRGLVRGARVGTHRIDTTHNYESAG